MLTPFSLAGKTALITGGATGLGLAMTHCMVAAGAKVVVVSRNGSEAFGKNCGDLGSQALYIQGDISDTEGIPSLVQRIFECAGPIDILVNNAGVTKDGLLMKMSEEDFSRVVDTNLKGTFNCIRHVSRMMLRQRSGRIISLSSVVGLRGNAGQANYAASKAGIIGLTKSAAKELASRGITVNAIAPGFIKTDMTDVLSDKVKENISASIPMGSMGTAEDVAKAAAFLASDGARYITGQVLRVDGGMAM